MIYSYHSLHSMRLTLGKHVLYLPARDIGYGIVLELKMESNKGKHRTVRVMWIFEIDNV